MNTVVLSILDRSSFLLVLNKDNFTKLICINLSPTTDFQLEKCCDHSSTFIFECIILILEGYKDIYTYELEWV